VTRAQLTIRRTAPGTSENGSKRAPKRNSKRDRPSWSLHGKVFGSIRSAKSLALDTVCSTGTLKISSSDFRRAVGVLDGADTSSDRVFADRDERYEARHATFVPHDEAVVGERVIDHRLEVRLQPIVARLDDRIRRAALWAASRAIMSLHRFGVTKLNEASALFWMSRASVVRSLWCEMQ
jgi:hypothetical protein